MKQQPINFLFVGMETGLAGLEIKGRVRTLSPVLFYQTNTRYLIISNNELKHLPAGENRRRSLCSISSESERKQIFVHKSTFDSNLMRKSFRTLLISFLSEFIVRLYRRLFRVSYTISLLSRINLDFLQTS